MLALGPVKVEGCVFSWDSFGRAGPELLPSCDKVATSRIQQALRLQFGRLRRANCGLSACWIRSVATRQQLGRNLVATEASEPEP